MSRSLHTRCCRSTNDRTCYIKQRTRRAAARRDRRTHQHRGAAGGAAARRGRRRPHLMIARGSQMPGVTLKLQPLWLLWLYTIAMVRPVATTVAKLLQPPSDPRVTVDWETVCGSADPRHLPYLSQRTQSGHPKVKATRGCCRCRVRSLAFAKALTNPFSQSNTLPGDACCAIQGRCLELHAYGRGRRPLPRGWERRGSF